MFGRAYSFFSRLLYFSLTLTLVAKGATSAAVTGPVLGYVYDAQAHKLKPLYGIAGAATFGDALDLGADITSGAVSPRQDYALVSTQGLQSLIIADLAHSPITLNPLTSVPAMPDLVAFSPGGSAAALYYSVSGAIQVLSGLPSNPAVSHQVDVSQLPSAPNAIAVSDDANSLLIAAGKAAFLVQTLSDDANSSQSRAARDTRRHGFEPGAAGSTIAGFFQVYSNFVSAVAFAPDSSSAFFADAANSQIYRIYKTLPVLLAGQADGVSTPIALAADASRIVVANSGTQSITVHDLSDSHYPPITLACRCSLTGIYALGARGVFRLTDVTDAPLSVLEMSNSDSRVVLIPSDRPITQRGTAK